MAQNKPNTTLIQRRKQYRGILDSAFEIYAIPKTR